MIGIKTKFTDDSKKVIDATKNGAFKNLGHAAASLRKDAVKSIRRRKDKRKASPVGTPPFTHTGLAKASIVFHVSPEDALIGFRYSKFGTVGATHEHGLVEEGRDYPERPTMYPALERSIARFHMEWRHSIG